MFLKRKFIVIFSLLTCVSIMALSAINRKVAVPTSVNILNPPKIILDAGHEGFS